MQDTDKPEISRLKEVVESLRAELASVISAADRNSVKLAKVTRQNGMYFKIIDELDEDHRVQLNDQKKKYEQEIRQIKEESTRELEAYHKRTRELEPSYKGTKGLEDYYHRQLDFQKRIYERQIRQTKKKQWCAVCFKEGMFFSSFYLKGRCFTRDRIQHDTKVIV